MCVFELYDFLMLTLCEVCGLLSPIHRLPFHLVDSPVLSVPGMASLGGGHSVLVCATSKQLQTLVSLLTGLGLTVSWVGLAGHGSRVHAGSTSLQTSGYLGHAFLCWTTNVERNLPNCPSPEESLSRPICSYVFGRSKAHSQAPCQCHRMRSLCPPLCKAIWQREGRTVDTTGEPTTCFLRESSSTPGFLHRISSVILPALSVSEGDDGEMSFQELEFPPRGPNQGCAMYLQPSGALLHSVCKGWSLLSPVWMPLLDR